MATVIDRDRVKGGLAALGLFLAEKGNPISTEQANICVDALTMMLKEQEPTKWISVKDRLPETAGYECLVCAVNENYNQTHVFTAFTGYGEPGWWTSNVHYMSRAKSPTDNRLHPALKVTHWMPLPEPPEEVTGNAE